MKTASKVFLCLLFLVWVTFSILAPAYAEMSDYCINPPFIVGGVVPNLLMMFDNSSSMFDLNYVDKGTATRQPTYCYDKTYKTNQCSTTTATRCAKSSECPSGETCKNLYTGIFEINKYYQYDFTNNDFTEIALFPPAGCNTYQVANTLCATVSGSAVTAFAAKGNYLNWLSASKFDIQKQILTGGKYVDMVCSDYPTTACTTAADCPSGGCSDVPNFLQSESRGCVGQRFIKEAITSDYSESGNTDLGITFAIRGPLHPYNESAPSPGGQTYVEIYEGNYLEGLCKTAIDDIIKEEDKQTTIDAIAACLTYTKGKTCYNDPSRACNQDSDCPTTAGTCGPLVPGTCEVTNDGNCSANSDGVCTPSNGLCTGAMICFGGTKAGNSCTGNNKCPQGVCRKQCVGGGKAGSQCTIDGDCNYKSCSNAGSKFGSICTAGTDCNTKTCKNAGKVGTTCTNSHPDCDTSQCKDPASMVGTSCTSDNNCSTSTCTAPLSKVGTSCTQNSNCDIVTGPCVADATTQRKITFAQSMHACYQFNVKNQNFGSNDITTISGNNGCNVIYRDIRICNGGARDGLTCSVDADCTGGGTCARGPNSIRPGSVVLVCADNYAGYCASTTDNWQNTTWNAREFRAATDCSYVSGNISDADCCVIKKYEQYCGAMEVPPVVDPTDDPSATTNFNNLPAILSGTGVAGQLGPPISTLNIQLRKDTAPTGLLYDFKDKIRLGSMIFNYNGTASECGIKVCSNNVTTTCATDSNCSPGRCIDPVPCPKKCSVSTNLACTTAADCPSAASGEICIDRTVGVDQEDRDGALIKYYIGDAGYCSTATSTSCTKDSDCGTGTCISVGNHNNGLLKEVDRIEAASWTPFTEAFYNAIGYYARTNPYSVSPGTSRTALRLNTGDFLDNKNPSQYECQKNNILLITDGSSTADLQTATVTLATQYISPADRTPAGQVGVCGNYKGSKNLDDVAWVAKHRNIKTFSPTSTDPKPAPALKNSEMIDTYVVFTGADNGLTGECNSLTMMNQTAANGGTTSAKMAEDPEKLYNALKESFQTIALGAGSGTAASVLASGEGSGANLIQALFYTTRDTFGTTVIDPPIKWTGTLKNLWYYIDPFIGNSTIREDAAVKDYTLAINTDKIVNFRFTGDKTVVDLYADANGDGVKDSATPSPKDVPFEDVSSLWEAGALLWKRSASDRKIYTYDGTKPIIELPNTISDGSTLKSLLQAVNADEATAIARYVKGEDVKVCNNSMKICTVLGNCDPVDTSCDAYRSRTVDSEVWKLGDIINSTPRIASWTPQNLYHKAYLDGEYRKFIESDDYGKRGLVFTGANDGMFHAFYLGQLELFSEKFKKAALADPYGIGIGKELWAYIPRNALPYLRYLSDKEYCHIYYADATPYIFDASINSPTGCGGDYWHCPKQTKCGANENCTTVKNTLDMANTSWRTVIIGSMRLGGGCKDPASASTLGVKTPLAGEGYSSYFALDITDNLAHPNDTAGHPPVLLWEFSNANIPALELATGGLGFSTTGPAVLRVAPKTGDTDSSGSEDGKDNPDNNKNGRFYVVIGSGPTGPIDTNQFRSYSDQPLKLFVLDLKTGALLKTFNETDFGIKNAFAGSMVNSMVDLDQDKPRTAGFYQDDAIYFGYTKAEENPLTASTKWNRGGIMRLFTKHELDPSLWDVSNVMDDPLGATLKDNIIGPVTAAVNRLQNYTKKTLRLFFGSGRYSYKISSDIDDDNPKDSSNNDIPRRLFGVIEPCFDTISGAIDFTCSASVSIGSLSEAANALGTSDADGWYINLDICTKLDTHVTPNVLTNVACTTTDVLGNTIPNPEATYKAERSVTDIAATPMGAVFFTTTKPSADVCAFGGGTHLWAVQYDTGGKVKSGVLRGKAIVQVSTGEIREVDLKSAFTEKDGRRTDIIPGVPPAGSPPGLIVPPQPANKVIHIRER